ncbi:MAG: hypothetical protein GY708_13665, partial [Actinomycetia bacterium]|nr:hypothetical protein [Actinomycetes bacterium]
MSLDGISSDDRFAILALDHRDSLRAFLRPDDPGSVERDEIVRLKAELISRVAQFATGVMLEPEYSIPDLVGSLPDGVGFTAALESQGYLGDPGAVPTTVLDGWSVEQAAASGASVAKLLLPFMPEHRLAEAQHQVAADVLAECRRVGIPLVLEPLFFGLADPADRPGVVIETTRRFAALG